MSTDPYYDNWHAENDHLLARARPQHSYWGGVGFGIMVVVAVYAWFKAATSVKVWLFLIFFGIPIPALWLSDAVPVVSILLVCLWIYVVGIGVVAGYRAQQMFNEAARQEALQAQQAEYDAAVQADINKVRYDHAVAQVTGQAVADALRGQQPPESPTGAPQGPTAPPPGPPAPMGSTTPTLWVPTFQGPKRRELQRSETTLDGLWMKDFRGVDPDDL